MNEMIEREIPMREKCFRSVCATNMGNGLCWSMEGTNGCKVGRGEAQHWRNCKATMDQLWLSSESSIAMGLLRTLAEPTKGMVSAGHLAATVSDFIPADKFETVIFTAMIDAAGSGE
jgi:hypothetical protein